MNDNELHHMGAETLPPIHTFVVQVATHDENYTRVRRRLLSLLRQEFQDASVLGTSGEVRDE